MLIYFFLFFFQFFFQKGSPFLSGSAWGFHIAAYSVWCYGCRTAGHFPCQKTGNFCDMYSSSCASIYAKILFLLCVRGCEEGASCNIHCFFLRLFQHSRDAGIQGSISPLAAEASKTCKAPKLLRGLYSQLRLRLRRFVGLWSVAGSIFV